MSARSGIGHALPLAFLGLPLVLLLALLRDPRLDPVVPAPEFHFAIVTFTAVAGGVLAAVLLIIAERLREPRGFFVGLAFAAMASFYFVHGFLTPGVIFRQQSTGMHWAPLVGLALAAACLALSTARPDANRWALRRRRVIGAAVLGVWGLFLTLSLTTPRFLEGHSPTIAGFARVWGGGPPPTLTTEEYARALVSRWGDSDHDHGDAAAHASTGMHDPVSAYGELTGQPWLGAALWIVAALLMTSTALRYGRQYRLSRLPTHAAIVWGVVLLLESLLTFVFATVWRVSWWEYHVLALLGVGVIVYGLTLDYKRGPGITQAFAALIAGTSVGTLESSYTEALTALTAAVEARDPYTRGHSDKVARDAVMIGERLRLSPESLRTLYHAGLLHDIGKIAIPDSILHKQGALTVEEFTLIKDHPARAEEIVARIPSLRSLRGGIRWHHERLDGSGYPDGLKGEQIPLEARIVSVADVFDAMTSGRSYRSALPVPMVLQWLDQRAGTQFDRQCVDALLQVVAADGAASNHSTHVLVPSQGGTVSS